MTAPNSQMATTLEPIKVLFHLHPAMDALDFIGPLEIFSHVKNPNTNTRIFACTITSTIPLTRSTQGAAFDRDIPIETAYAQLASFSILVIPGGAVPPLVATHAEPISLIKAFAALPPLAGRAHRTILSICTGSLFLGAAGVLKGLTATTHWGSYAILREMVGSETEVVEDRFVVNKVGGEKPLRVITSGGISCGMDASLWLVESVAGVEMRESVEKTLEYKYRGPEGLVLG